MNNIKISVIIPIYNVEKYLEKCINSILHQTYKLIEIICVDDGSTDASGEICDEFAKLDSRIVVIHKENGGISSALNVGLSIARGDFVTVVGADDWLELNMYEMLVAEIISGEIDMVACGFFKHFEDKCLKIKNELPVPRTPMSAQEFLQYVYIRDKYQAVSTYLVLKLFRLEVIKENDLWFREDIRIGEDVIFLAQFLVCARKICYIDTPLYYYRQHTQSVMHNFEKRLDGFQSCVAYQTVIDLFQEKGIDNYIIDYVKRYYVYHAFKLLEMAYFLQKKECVEPLKENIKKYLDEYCETNKEYPERIEHIMALLKEEM